MAKSDILNSDRDSDGSQPESRMPRGSKTEPISSKGRRIYQESITKELSEARRILGDRWLAESGEAKHTEDMSAQRKSAKQKTPEQRENKRLKQKGRRQKKRQAKREKEESLARDSDDGSHRWIRPPPSPTELLIPDYIEPDGVKSPIGTGDPQYSTYHNKALLDTTQLNARKSADGRLNVNDRDQHNENSSKAPETSFIGTQTEVDDDGDDFDSDASICALSTDIEGRSDHELDEFEGSLKSPFPPGNQTEAEDMNSDSDDEGVVSETSDSFDAATMCFGSTQTEEEEFDLYTDRDELASEVVEGCPESSHDGGLGVFEYDWHSTNRCSHKATASDVLRETIAWERRIIKSIEWTLALYLLAKLALKIWSES